MSISLFIRNALYIAVIVVISLLIGSCKQKVKKQSHLPQLEYDSFSKNLASAVSTSSEFVKKLKYANLPFLKQLVNDPYQYRDYKKDINVSAANIGIYMTDAQYLNAYGKGEEAYLSAKAAQRLFQMVETNMLDTSLAQMKAGYQPKDSALFFLNHALKDTSNGLSEGDRKAYILSMGYGNFIERNYILLSLLKTQSDFVRPEAAILFKYIKKHNSQLATILQLRKTYTAEGYHNYLLQDLMFYQDYFMANIELFDEGSNEFRQKEFMLELLRRTEEMRNYIIYDGLLLKQ